MIALGGVAASSGFEVEAMVGGARGDRAVDEAAAARYLELGEVAAVSLADCGRRWAFIVEVERVVSAGRGRVGDQVVGVYGLEVDGGGDAGVGEVIRGLDRAAYGGSRGLAEVLH